MSQIFNRAIRLVEHFGYDDFLVMFAVAVVLGVLCLRGFGSRTNY